jgi:hypothetical protein
MIKITLPLMLCQALAVVSPLPGHPAVAQVAAAKPLSHNFHF